jgi:hypothetical protein
MAIETKTIRRKFSNYSTSDYLAAQHKIDHIQLSQPKSFKGNEKGDEYKLYYEQIKKHAPVKNVTEFLAWDENAIINRVNRVFEQKRINDWGDEYDIDEDEIEERKILREAENEVWRKFR